MTEVSELANEAYEYAVAWLARRDRSTTEMRKMIERRGFAPAIAEATIGRLVENNFINDERLRNALAREFQSQSRGYRDARQRLQLKGLTLSEAEYVAAAVEGSTTDPLEVATTWATRRYPTFTSDTRERQKAFAALVRRGFSFEVAQAAVSPGRNSR